MEVEDNLIILTSEEFETVKQNALRELDTTYEELEQMHSSGDYKSVRHKLLWMSIRKFSA